MEEAAAETIWRNGFTQKKVTTNIRSKKDLVAMAQNLVSMRSKDVVILPEGSDLNNLVPGTSEFPAYHNIFMELIAIRLGIPKSLLLMAGNDSNRSTLMAQIKDMRDDLANDELVVKQVIEEQIFRPACELRFGEEFLDIPEFIFEPIQMDKTTTIEHIKDTSTYVVQLVNSANILKQMGKETESNKILEYMMTSIDENYKLGETESKPTDEKSDEKKPVEKTDDKNGKDPEQIQPETPRIPPASKKLKAGNDSEE